MNENPRLWLKPVLTILILAVITWLCPVAPLDPWQLLSPKKIATMVLALAAIQASGSIMAQYLGTRLGAILTGFLGGLISSTATTASLARASKVSNKADISGETLTFLAATCAMLFEGFALVLTGSSDPHLSTLFIWLGPILATVGIIIFHFRKAASRSPESTASSSFQILPPLKLTVFIIAILSVSKVFQNLFGQNGLVVLTALVSLFEIHGSVIANVQLHDSGSLTDELFGALLVISIVASFVSKLFLISTLGTKKLRNDTFKLTLLLLCALAVSWGATMSL